MYLFIQQIKSIEKNNDASQNSETDCIDLLNTFGIMAYFLAITYGFEIY